jgi:prepilin-type N-terminal cleavage/methylation domain-containing protein
MKTRLQSRAPAGFVVLATLIELLVVIAIIGILIGLQPAMVNVQWVATRMAAYPSLAPLATQILQFNQASASNAQAFTLSIATDAQLANGSTFAEVNVDSLKFFCNADTKLTGLQNQVNALLATGVLSSEERTRLTDTQKALDGELPAVQKLGQLLRSKVSSLCPSTIP